MDDGDRAPISVVIPTLDAGAALPGLLGDLVPGAAEGLIREVIVSDGGSADDGPGIARGMGARVLTGPPGRGGQLRRGCAAARGAWIWALHADTRLPAGWTGPVARFVEGGDRAGWARLSFRAPGLAPRWVAGWANLRSRAGLPYGDQGLLVPRTLYEAAGGYPDQPLMEDVALARALRARLAPLDLTISTDAARYQGRWMRRGAANLGTLARWAAGVPPERLAERYRR
ncbi:MAG: glycosyltransferase [Hasllibacter sp.]